MSTPRVRIAPSPTGYMHVGTARLALFNLAFAKQQHGSLVLRIEDTDKQRSKKEYEEAIFEGLRWLKIVPDEGPEQSGPYMPYRQSERVAFHTQALQSLLQVNKIFYCLHKAGSEEEHAVHWCDDRDKNLSSGILRFKTPRDRDIIFQDLIRGEMKFNTETVGDFSVARSLESPLYHFAVVVDDHVMKITHVLRGEDILPSTPKHMLMQEALGYEQPTYGHLPLVLGPDRSKLSKRHGPTSLLEFREKGYLPEALINFLALIGWNPGTDQEIFSLEEFIQEFSLDKVQKSGAIFDFQKLDWMNGEYIRKKPLAELVSLCIPFIADFLQTPIPNDQFSREYIERVVALEQPRLKKLSEIGERVDYFFRQPVYDRELLRWKSMDDKGIGNSLESSQAILLGLDYPEEAEVPKEVLEETFLRAIGDGDKGSLLWPLRVALSGKKASPGPFEIMAVLGIKESLTRIKRAKELLTVWSPV